MDLERSDADLCAASLGGDAEAFAALTERHAGVLVGRLRRSVSAREDVEDLAQEVLLRAYASLGDLRSPERFAAWLGAIADNVARMWHRRRFRQLSLEAALEPEPPDRPPLEGEADRRRLRASLRGALRSLSTAQRDVVIQHYFKGYSYAETAALLGLDVGTVRSRLQNRHCKLPYYPRSGW